MQSLETASQFEAAQTRAVEIARAKTTANLNQIARRLKQYKAEADWYEAVLDGASRFAARIAAFAIQDDSLVLKGVRELTLPAQLTVSLSGANAFRNARDSGETIITLCTAREVSEPIVSVTSGERAFIVPISNGTRIAALLFASEGENTDANGLELIANIASAVLERHSQSSHVQIVPVAPAEAQPVPEGERIHPGERHNRNRGPDWDRLPEQDRIPHLRAHRLARTKVAEMQLYRPDACATGREQKDIYLFLKQEIDAAREIFRAQFMSAQSMVDYLHLELLRQLAENDEAMLGADYPGQMV